MNNPIATLVTAAQIEASCPARLTDLGKRIVTHLAKADQCDAKANDHRISATQYLQQAKDACDEGGFKTFCDLFQIGRSRAYELLSIASGRKTVTEVRAATAVRVRRHREKATTLSVSVTEHAEVTRPTVVAVTHRTSPDETVCIPVEIADEVTPEEMMAEPAEYWLPLDRLLEAFHAARKARNSEDALHALSDLIAAASELKKFYEAHLLAGQRLQ